MLGQISCKMVPGMDLGRCDNAGLARVGSGIWDHEDAMDLASEPQGGCGSGHWWWIIES
jgi:hypothetical protein